MALLRAARARGARLPVAAAVYLLAEAARGLGHLHALLAEGSPTPILHGGIEPGKLLVDARGEVKLNLGWPGYLPPPRHFIAPEILTGAALDVRSDVFALGLVLYSALCGAHLFDGQGGVDPVYQAAAHAGAPAPSRCNPAVPASVDRLVQRALERRPAARHPTAAELERDLRGALAALHPGFGAAEMRALIGPASERAPGSSAPRGAPPSRDDRRGGTIHAVGASEPSLPVAAPLSVPTTRLAGHSTAIVAADWTPGSSRLVAVGAGDPLVRVWSVETAQVTAAFEVAGGASLARLYPSGDRLAVAQEGAIRVVELATGAEIEAVRPAGDPVIALAVAGDGERLFWASRPTSPELWSWRPGEEPRRSSEGFSTFEREAFLSPSRDGAELWCFLAWDVICLDARTGAAIAHLRGDRGEALGAGFASSAEGHAVAVASRLNRDDETTWAHLRKWDIASNRILWSHRVGHDARWPVLAAANGAWLVRGGRGSVMFHATRTGAPLGELRLDEPEATITCLRLSPDDRRLAVGTGSGGLLVYELGDALVAG